MLHNFWTGHESTGDSECSERLTEDITPEIIDVIHDLVKGDRRVKMQKIVRVLIISGERVFCTNN